MEIYITIKGDIITFPLDFNYIIDSVSADFDYNVQLQGVINRKEKNIVCNNGIGFTIILYTEDSLVFEYDDGRIFYFENTKYFVKNQKEFGM